MVVSPMPDRELPVLRAAVATLAGVEEHPNTVSVEVLTAPNGQRVAVLMEITRGPLKIHVFKVTPDGDILRVRNGR